MKTECIECEGTGIVFYSCCGDDIRGNDIDLCPSCYEHCDTEDGEECESCGGTGEIDAPNVEIPEILTGAGILNAIKIITDEYKEDKLHSYKQDQQDYKEECEDYNREQNAKWADDSEG